MAHEAGKGDKQRPTDYAAFSSNFDQVFSGKVQRGGWVQDRITGKLVPRGEYQPDITNAPMVMKDIAGYKSQVTGEWIGSRSQHREHLKEHRLVEVGNEIKHHMSSRPDNKPAGNIKQDIANAMHRLGI
jgi:hypothetical protein